MNRIRIGYGKSIDVRMKGRTIKEIWRGSGRYGSKISLPIRNSPAVFIVELDLDRYCIGLQGDPSVLDDEAFYWVNYAKSPESFGFAYYATVSNGRSGSPIDEYYGVS